MKVIKKLPDLYKFDESGKMQYKYMYKNAELTIS